MEEARAAQDMAERDLAVEWATQPTGIATAAAPPANCHG